jgi:hypothetical protein
MLTRANADRVLQNLPPLPVAGVTFERGVLARLRELLLRR